MLKRDKSMYISLQWRHNERNGVSNHQPHDCLLNRLFRRRSKKTSKLRVAGLCEGNLPMTGEFPAQMASNVENVRFDSQIKNENSMDIAQVDIIEVTNAISALNANKSDGSLGLYSNHLLIASSHLHRYIALLFTFMLRHGHNPDCIMEAIISSIPKNANGQISDSENYRGIALSSAIGKVLDIIIMNRYSNELMSSNLQFSFKPKHSTVMCTAAMREIFSHYTSRSSRVYMCALDATKAFDKVNFPKLFHLLLKRNVPSVILRIVLDM